MLIGSLLFISRRAPLLRQYVRVASASRCQRSAHSPRPPLFFLFLFLSRPCWHFVDRIGACEGFRHPSVSCVCIYNYFSVLADMDIARAHAHAYVCRHVHTLYMYMYALCVYTYVYFNCMIFSLACLILNSSPNPFLSSNIDR